MRIQIDTIYSCHCQLSTDFWHTNVLRISIEFNQVQSLNDCYSHFMLKFNDFFIHDFIKIKIISSSFYYYNHTNIHALYINFAMYVIIKLAFNLLRNSSIKCFQTKKNAEIILNLK